MARFHPSRSLSLASGTALPAPLDLEPRHIDYLWQPDVAGMGSARIAITGDWDNPQYKVQSVTITKDLVLPRGLKLRSPQRPNPN
jgi:hypothetical protein